MLKRATYETLEERAEQYHVFTIDDAYRSPLMRQFFQLRKKVFVDGMGWDLPKHELGEVDQYDRKGAAYVISEKNGDVVGGMRLMPTTTAFLGRDGKRYTYMIKDAREGNLSNMPSDLINCEAPVEETLWEMTRVITSKEPYHLKNLIHAACNFLKTKDATHFLYHTRPAAGRLGKIWGYEVDTMGPPVAIGGIRFQVNKVKVK